MASPLKTLDYPNKAGYHLKTARVTKLVKRYGLTPHHVGYRVPQTQRGFGAKSKNMYYVYLLKSKLDNKLYVGQTSNLRQRIRNHALGKVLSTRHRRPLVLIFYEAFSAKADAVRREKYFKTSKGNSSIKQIIRGSLD